MKKSIGVWQLWGFALTSLLGTLLHFLYEWTKEAVYVAPFSGVNESTWEHMKLLFWPMFLFAVAESFFFRDQAGFWCIKLRGTLLGLVLIPVLFYTYNGAIGKSSDAINVGIFFLSAALAYLYETAAFKKEDPPCRFPRLSFLLLCLIALSFVLFTFLPPELGIFLDPLTGSYGIGA